MCLVSSILVFEDLGFEYPTWICQNNTYQLLLYRQELYHDFPMNSPNSLESALRKKKISVEEEEGFPMIEFRRRRFPNDRFCVMLFRDLLLFSLKN